MTTPAHRHILLEAIRLSSRPLDDDQLSVRTGITPRQTVNQICRELARQGVIRRVLGPDMKLVNEIVEREDVRLVDAPAVDTDDATMDRASDHTAPPGSSREQRDAERVMLDLLGTDLGVMLEPATITVPSGARVEVDGADAGRTVLVECWAHQGAPKAAQKHKVLSDALKLMWISSTIYPRPRLVLCMCDPAAAAPFQPTAKTWAARALQDLDIAVAVVELADDLRRLIEAAQKRQYR